jgi:tRNA A-37 threonylcarbamoyl transferase component Bud32
MIAEMLNQDFAFNTLEDMPQQKRAGIHVPKIYRVIEAAATVYIVIEYVNGKTLKELLEEGVLHY